MWQRYWITTIFISTYTRTCTHTHTHMHIRTYTHTCTHTYTHTCTHMHTYTHTCTHAHIHTRTSMFVSTYMHTCTHTHMHTCKTEMRAVRTMVISKQTKKGRKRERKIARARALLKVSTCVCNEHLKKIGIHVPLCRMHFVHKIAVTLECTVKTKAFKWLALSV